MEATTLPRRFGAPVKAAAPPKGRALPQERVALVATAVGIALLPLLVPAGPANLAPVDALIAVTVFTCLVWALASGQRLQFPYIVPLFLLLVGGALGAAIGPVPLTGVVALVQDVWLIAWCWSVVNISRSAQNLKTLMATWAYSAMGWAVLLYVGLLTGSSALTGQIEKQGSRVQLTLEDPSYAANYFFISIMIIWATARPRNRAMRLVAYALLVPAIALTGSNSGIVSLIVGVAVAAAVGVYRRFGLAHMTAVVAVMLLGGGLVAANISLSDIQDRAHASRYAFLRDGIGRGTSVEQRGNLLAESIDLYRSGSPFGEGPVSTKTRLLNAGAPFPKEAHDDYLAALLERGAIGFVGVLLLVAGLGLRSLAVVRGRLAGGFAAVVARPNALLGAVLGTMAAGTVYELFHVRHVWALFGLVAALYIWGRE